MKKLMTCAGALSLAIGLSACGTSEEPASNVAAENDMNAMMADPANPFSASETKMHGAMQAAVGTNAADSWVRKMIEHHRGAVEMSQILIDQGVTGHVADMARKTIDKQGKEITELEKLVAAGSPDPASARPYAAAEARMHEAMMAAKGTDVSDSYVRKMLEHHKGAVALVDVALANGATGAVRSAAEKVKSDQQKEIAHIESMLSGAAPAATAAPAEPQATSAATSAPAQPKETPAKKVPAPAKPKPEPAPADPHAGHDMNNM